MLKIQGRKNELHNANIFYCDINKEELLTNEIKIHLIQRYAIYACPGLKLTIDNINIARRIYKL